MSFDYTDQDGARFQVAPAENFRVGKQIYVQLGSSEGYVAPERASDAAAAFLESAGVEVDHIHELDWRTDPAGHEAFALAHLQAAADVRRQEEIRKARHALADAVRKEFPELDPYEGVEWDRMTHEGRRIHLNRLARLLKVFNAQDGISIPDPWGKTDTAEPPTTATEGGGE